MPVDWVFFRYYYLVQKFYKNLTKKEKKWSKIDCFPKIKKFWKTISLSLVASPIYIIFFYSCGKHNFLAPSLSHGKLSHFLSLLFAFYLIIYSLFWIPSLIFFSKKFLVWRIPGISYFFLHIKMQKIYKIRMRPIAFYVLCMQRQLRVRLVGGVEKWKDGKL